MIQNIATRAFLISSLINESVYINPTDSRQSIKGQ